MGHVWGIEACLQRPNHQPICPAYWILKKQGKPFGPVPSGCYSCLARVGGASDCVKYCALPCESFASGFGFDCDPFPDVGPPPVIGSGCPASAAVPGCD